MKNYKIFKHPSGDMRVIKKGWSWPAFFLGWIWALRHGLWSLALGVLVAGVLAGIVARGMGDSAGGGLIVLFGVLNAVTLGCVGNLLRADRQASEGYACVDTVAASNAEIALSIHERGLGAGMPLARELRG
ncbi:MAG: DUF2628 domain-containing protein [Pseudomonadota bacterium]|jgi:hypothetical protein